MILANNDLFSILTSKRRNVASINLSILTERQFDFYKERFAFIACDMKSEFGSIDKAKAQKTAFRLALREEKEY